MHQGIRFTHKHGLPTNRGNRIPKDIEREKRFTLPHGMHEIP